MTFQRLARSRRVHTEAPGAEQHYKPRYSNKPERVFSPTIVLMGVMPIAAFVLGTWQVGRLQWKLDIIKELEEKLSRDPLPLPNHVKSVIFFYLFND